MTDYPLPAPGEITGWTTPPTDGGERLDGRSTVLLTVDRLITGRFFSTNKALNGYPLLA